ncbi:glyoxalase/bleomycin resistance/dioxygenase family protein [Pelagibius litoralis]|uniref:Glyoxalase/bleomycin resistance/dioxygenase family protein n=1 Tax=Pelagibius litoralis TaxID=374515 RepID=A0A967C2V7_9PROT|nr:ArsI/CadI family heavy metal resistance metalloenzyme [Pelagibius litoralis]NIA67374.1 glyoxalase/bleomycin resistance/dioxygenase family protein [Pelagibius litoralis]
MRLQLALNVPDIDQAVAYYSKLFGVTPHKRRDGYANFAIEAPPLKLVLFEQPDAGERLNHLGVEVLDRELLGRNLQRLTDAGILEEVQRDETCCHATQDKVWSRAPDGTRWEWYRITDDNPAPARETLGGVCCARKEATEDIGLG